MDPQADAVKRMLLHYIPHNVITDCLINKTGEDISKYPNGSFEELREYIRGASQQ